MKTVIVPVIWKPSKQLHFCKTNAVFHYKNDILKVKHDGNSLIIWGCFSDFLSLKEVFIMLYTRQFFRIMSVHELKFIWMIMQQDNDPKHQIKSTSECLKRKKQN